MCKHLPSWTVTSFIQNMQHEEDNTTTNKLRINEPIKKEY